MFSNCIGPNGGVVLLEMCLNSEVLSAMVLSFNALMNADLSVRIFFLNSTSITDTEEPFGTAPNSSLISRTTATTDEDEPLVEF